MFSLRKNAFRLWQDLPPSEQKIEKNFQKGILIFKNDEND